MPASSPIRWLVAACAVSGAFAHAAGAATITPTRTDDPVSGGDACMVPPLDCSLRNAVLAAQPGGTVDLSGAPQTYDLTQGALPITNSMTLVGAGARSTTIRRTAGTGSVIFVGANLWGYVPKAPRTQGVIRVAISGVTLTGGLGQPLTDGQNATEGGGIDINTAQEVVLRGMRITGNQAGRPNGEAQGIGGGVFALIANVGLIDSEVTDNTSFSGPDDRIPGSALRGGVGSAGGIYHAGATIEVVNTTVARNTAEWGGGIYQAGGPGIGDDTNRIVLDNATVVGNTATGELGNIDLFDGTIEMRNSIVAGGQAPRGDANCGGGAGPQSFLSRGHNLESPGNECRFTGPGDLSGVTSVGLGDLGDHGGQSDTMVPQATSLAIDGGDPAGCATSLGDLLTDDQRGLPRPIGGRCDIGAVETSADRGEYPGCRLVGTPQAQGNALISTVTCGSDQILQEDAAVAIDPAPAAGAARARMASAPHRYPAGRLTRRIPRHRRIRLRLPINHSLSSVIRQARARHDIVMVGVHLKARRPPRRHHR